MAEPLTIRLSSDDRRVLEDAAHEQGKGLSTFVREIAEATVRSLRRDVIRADGERVMEHVRANEQARRELDDLGTPQGEFDEFE